MSMMSRLRQTNRLYLEFRRHFSSLLNPDPKCALTAMEKTHILISRMVVETDPKKFIPLCRVAELTPACREDRVAFRTFVHRLVELNYRKGIRKFIEELKEKRQDLRPDLKSENFHCLAMGLYGRAGMLGDSIRTFQEMDKHGIPRSVNSFNALLSSCLAAKEYGEMDRIFKEFPTHYGIMPNSISYDNMIAGLCFSGSSGSVYSIIEEMVSRAILPTRVSFGYLLAGIYNEGKIVDVEGVLKLMGKHRCPRTFKTFNISINVLCSVFQKPSQAKLLLDFMASKEKKPNDLTYIFLIRGFICAGNLVEAKVVLENMKSAGFKPSINCSELVRAGCKIGEFDFALEICKGIVSSGAKPQFLMVKSLVNGLKSVSKIEEAREFLRELFENFRINQFKINSDLWNELETSLSE